jgi:hypothetical protein
MFTDLNHLCTTLSSKGVDARLTELVELLPAVAVYAVGGFPITLEVNSSLNTSRLLWMGNDLDTIKHFIKEGLGVSAALTYVNPKNKSLDELGQLCLDKGHVWAYHWISVSMVMSGYPQQVEMAFARDTRFKMSWPVECYPTGRVFGATASIKDWLDYTKHEEDLSFDAPTRSAMIASRNIIKKKILP